MKKIYMYAAAMLCGLAMTTSCTKEDMATNGIPEGALEIFAEGSGTKTTVSGTSVKWAVGDEMMFFPYFGSSVGGTVQQNGDHWYVVKEGEGNFNFTSSFNTYYPSSIATASGTRNLTACDGDWTTTVVFPESYNSSFDGDRQVIALPMAATSAADATHIEMKHLSAGINVNVKNAFANDTVLYVDSVKVTSSEVNLSGKLNLKMRTNQVPAIASRGDQGTHSVTVKFSTPIALAVDESRCIQVPVLPGSEDLGTVTINVYTHLMPWKYGIVDVFTYERSKASFGALGRNQVKASPEIAIVRGGDNITRRERGAFSISDRERVIFSPGNLQYRASTDSWRFALNQYDYVGDADNGNVYEGGVKCNNALKSASYDGWIDFFGWGTWTGSNPDPTKNTTIDTLYKWDDDDFMMESKLADATQQGYNWRTLDGFHENYSNYEWSYLIAYRQASTIGGTANARYLKATVDGHRCLILFPDEFVWNVSTMGDVPTTCNIANDEEFTHTLTLTQWQALENVGAVLLPAAGFYGDGKMNYVGQYVYCWAAKLSSFTGSYSAGVRHGGTVIAAKTLVECSCLRFHYFATVRLVRDAN